MSSSSASWIISLSVYLHRGAGQQLLGFLDHILDRVGQLTLNSLPQNVIIFGILQGEFTG